MTISSTKPVSPSTIAKPDTIKTYKDTIPAFYRKFFLIVDPTIAVWAIYMNFATPEKVIDAYLPREISPYNPLQQDFLLYQISGGLLLCAFLDVFLLRRTGEVWIWRTQQWGQLLYDCVILWGQAVALSQQGRLSFTDWRLEDWGSLGITAGCGLVRLLFCVGFGFGSVAKGDVKEG